MELRKILALILAFSSVPWLACGKGSSGTGGDTDDDRQDKEENDIEQICDDCDEPDDGEVGPDNEHDVDSRPPHWCCNNHEPLVRAELVKVLRETGRDQH